MATTTGDLLQGTLSILILKALLGGSNHGFGVARWIEATTRDVLSIEEGSLYPALNRLEDKEMIEAEWGLSENNRRARFYSLTARGRHALQAEAESWNRFADAIAKVLRASRPQTA